MINKGIHLIYDFEGLVAKDEQQTREIANTVFGLMQETCKDAGINVVGKNISIFTDPVQSPYGFASVLLLDESHVSAHCYSDERHNGLLAVDFFSCGNLERGSRAGEMLKDRLEVEFPNLVLKKFLNISRF